MKIILDTDPGVDDFIAISLVIKSKKFDLLGITTVEGNCPLGDAIKSTFKTLEMCDSLDIPVYKGSKNNYLGTPNASYVHGRDGLGGVKYDEVKGKVQSQSAVDYLIETVNKYPNEITLITLGPLTNISECIKKDKTFPKKVKQLIIMGGSASYGNITPYAEFNFYKDPYSAHDVLNANFNNILIFGWDVTTKIPMSKSFEERMLNSNNKLLRFIYDITRKVEEHDSKLYGGAVISDALLIAYLIDNSVAKLDYANVEIITDGEKSGQSIVKFVDISNIRFATNSDGNKFYDMLFKYLSRE